MKGSKNPRLWVAIALEYVVNAIGEARREMQSKKQRAQGQAHLYSTAQIEHRGNRHGEAQTEIKSHAQLWPPDSTGVLMVE